jgi:hypothetical protein
MITSDTSRSVRSLAMASSRYLRPFMVTSAEAVVINRPGMRSTPGSGRKMSWSTPTGTTWSRPGSTAWSAAMSVAEFCETVMTRVMRLATRVCILVKAYQRALEKRSHVVRACSISRRRSTVMGWWMVASTGRPIRSMARRP